VNEEFYIGWQAKSPAGLGRFARDMAVALAVLAICLSVLLASSQRTIGRAVFEWGTEKSFEGLLRLQPYPHLTVSRPGGNGVSAYYLVAPFKFGLDTNALASLDDKFVTLKGTLIYRENQTMIEAKPASIKALDSANDEPRSAPPQVNLGRQTLLGEIVDSKCYLGVMNPGQLAPHRACAVRCISGGIPPVLLVRQKSGPPLYFLLVDEQGGAVNKRILDRVAVPLRITGEVVRQGELLTLRANPAEYRPAGQ
jgi:hypothetical protein